MFRNLRVVTGLASLILGMSAASTVLAAANTAIAVCSDPAVVAAIDTKEATAINENRLPGSGLALSSLPALSGVQITDHQIEIVDGRFTRDPNITICRVKMHLKARTLNGPKEAEENFTYRIERSANSYTVTFCPNGHCAIEAAPVKLAGPAR